MARGACRRRQLINEVSLNQLFHAFCLHPHDPSRQPNTGEFASRQPSSYCTKADGQHVGYFLSGQKASRQVTIRQVLVLTGHGPGVIICLLFQHLTSDGVAACTSCLHPEPSFSALSPLIIGPVTYTAPDLPIRADSKPHLPGLIHPGPCQALPATWNGRL